MPGSIGIQFMGRFMEETAFVQPLDPIREGKTLKRVMAECKTENGDFEPGGLFAFGSVSVSRGQIQKLLILVLCIRSYVERELDSGTGAGVF